MAQRLRVMHDHGCWPLWLVRDGAPASNVDPEALRISAALSGRLRAWQLWGDSRVNIADPLDSRTVGDSEDDAFDDEGRLLAERVAAEVPDTVVTYWKDD